MSIPNTDNKDSSIDYLEIKRKLYKIYLNQKCWIENYFYNFQDKNEITELYPNIFIGNYSTSTNKQLLLDKNITHLQQNLIWVLRVFLLLRSRFHFCQIQQLRNARDHLHNSQK